MIRLCVYEDAIVEHLEPITLTRPMTEVFLGTTKILDKFLTIFRPQSWGLWLRPQMITLARHLYSEIPVNDPVWLSAGEVVLVNARWLPPTTVNISAEPFVGVCNETPVVIRLSRRQTIFETTDWPLSIDQLVADLPTRDVGGVLISYPWDLIAANEKLLVNEASAWWRNMEENRLPQGVTVVGDPRNNLYIAVDVRLEPPIVFNLSQGPVLVDCGAYIQAFSRIEGPCYIGKKTVICSGARIGHATSIGMGCRVGGEVETSIFQGWSNKYHDGFLGHSWVGEWVNIAAGVQVSDLRHDYRTVPVYNRGIRVDSNLVKLGAFIGDHTKIGLGVLVNTGSLFGAFCSILPCAGYAPNWIPSFSRLVHEQIRQNDDLETLFDTARRVMQRRGCKLDSALVELYRYVYHRTTQERSSFGLPCSKWALRATA